MPHLRRLDFLSKKLVWFLVASFSVEAGAADVSWLRFPNWTSGDMVGIAQSDEQIVDTRFEVSNGRFQTGSPSFDPGDGRPIVDPLWPFKSRLLPSLVGVSPNGPTASDLAITYSLTFDYGSGGFPAGGLLAIGDLEAVDSSVVLTGLVAGAAVPVDWSFTPYIAVGTGAAPPPSWNATESRLVGTGGSAASTDNVVLLKSNRAFDVLRLDVTTLRIDGIRFSSGVATPSIIEGKNLIANGSAEVFEPIDPLPPGVSCAANPAGCVADFPGWQRNGRPFNYRYSSTTVTQIGSTGQNLGSRYFYGGDQVFSKLSQSIDVSEVTGLIENGAVRFKLSGWIGALGEVVPDEARVVATFLGDPVGSGFPVLGSAELLPITVSELIDQSSRGSGILLRNVSDRLPMGTRTVQLEIQFARKTGALNDAIVDQLSLQLEGVFQNGDYNKNGVVDAADYTVWRDQQGMSGGQLTADGTGPLGTPDGLVDAEDYNLWKSQFGKQSSDLQLESSATFLLDSHVPEPSAIALILLAAMLRCWARPVDRRPKAAT